MPDANVSSVKTIRRALIDSILSTACLVAQQKTTDVDNSQYHRAVAGGYEANRHVNCNRRFNEVTERNSQPISWHVAWNFVLFEKEVAS